MQTLKAREVMTVNLMSVKADMTLHELATFLAENQISGAPVLDNEGKLVGVVSLMDIALSEAERASVGIPPGAYWGGWERKLNPEDIEGMHPEGGRLRVRDIMTPVAYTIPETTPVSEIAKTMIAGRVHRLLVTRENHVVGIVTPLDLLKLLVNTESFPGVFE